MFDNDYMAKGLLKYNVPDPWSIVELFEKKIAEYAGAPFAVSTDNCTNAVFLSLKYLKASGEITIPKNTYLSIPGAIIHANCKPIFEDKKWSGLYKLDPYPIVDGAGRFRKGMYQHGTYHCLSFHIKKTVAIGKGGLILTDNEEAVTWFKRNRYSGRDERINHDAMEEPKYIGWNMYLFPELALRGLELFEKIPDYNEDVAYSEKYADISKYKIFK